MDEETMITVKSTIGLEAGDTIAIYEPDERILVWIWCWIVRKPVPKKAKYYGISEIDPTTITNKELSRMQRVKIFIKRLYQNHQNDR